jgi:DNA replication protein DnaC
MEIMASSGAPTLHRDWLARCEKEGWPQAGGWRDTYDHLYRLLGKPFLVSLIGDRGTGKTQLGVTIMYAASKLGIRSLYTTAFRMAKDLSRPPRFTDTLGENAAKYVGVPVLVIDEVNEGTVDKRAMTEITDALDQRYGRKLGTLLISNESLSGFRDLVGASIASRMDERGGLLVCGWPSFRGESDGEQPTNSPFDY